MAEVDGKVAMHAPDGRMYLVPKDQVELQQQDQKWTLAPDDAVAARTAEREQYARYGSTGQQALGAAETVARTATLGLVPGFGSPEDVKGRSDVLHKESPVVAFGAQAAGAALPMLAGGALAEGAVGALGASEALPLTGALGESIAVPTAASEAVGGLAGTARSVTEGLAGGTADEVEQARYETRDVSPGNIFLAGLGGELIGHALPRGLSMGAGRIKSALTAAEEAAGEGVPNALARAEARSVEQEAKIARDLPLGTEERAAAMRRTADAQFDGLSKTVPKDLTGLVDTAAAMGDTAEAKSVTSRLRETMAEPAPVQTEWFTGAKRQLSETRQALRAPSGPAEPPSIEQYLDGFKTPAARQRAYDDVTSEVMARVQKRGLAPEAGSSEWETIQRDVLGEKAGAEAPSLSRTAGLSKYAARVDETIGDALKRLDKTDDTTRQYLITRSVKKELGAVKSELAGLAGKVDQDALDRIQGVVNGAYAHVEQGLTDKSLFGGAADIERDISGPWHDKVAGSVGAVQKDLGRSFEGGSEFDPGKVRSFLKKDAIDRQLSQGKLEQVLEGAEELAAAHERNGTWPAANIAAQRERISNVRAALGVADEVHVANGAADFEAKAAKESAKAAKAAKASGAGGGFGSDIAEGLSGFALEHVVGHAIPFAGQLLKWGKRIAGMDAAGRAATRQVARNLAGVGLGAAERVLGQAGTAAASTAVTALSRFTGDYAGPEESFEAKRKLLDAEQVSPDVLYETLGQSLGDLPKLNPELFQTIAARTADKVRYIRMNLPPGLAVSLLYPDGTPPSRSALRDFAVEWNTVMDPHTVLEDIDAGTATPQQMQIMQASDPDLYQQLRSDCIEQVGTHFRDVPMKTKLELDLLFDADGLAGPMFSSKAADMIGAAQQSSGGQPHPAPPPSGDEPGGRGPSGLEAIKSSVTNKGG